MNCAKSGATLISNKAARTVSVRIEQWYFPTVSLAAMHTSRRQVITRATIKLDEGTHTYIHTCPCRMEFQTAIQSIDSMHNLKCNRTLDVDLVRKRGPHNINATAVSFAQQQQQQTTNKQGAGVVSTNGNAMAMQWQCNGNAMAMQWQCSLFIRLFVDALSNQTWRKCKTLPHRGGDRVPGGIGRREDAVCHRRSLEQDPCLHVCRMRVQCHHMLARRCQGD